MKYLKLVRPKQWLKNSYVLAPLIFSGSINFDLLILSSKLVLVFILASSCVYIFNDIHDEELDRKHPKKKHRPIASGELQRSHAINFLLILFAILIFSLYYLEISIQSILLILLYLLLNFLYSTGLKNIPLLELAILSSGFVIRLIAGSIEISIILSPWLIVCSGLLSLMLAVGKRRNELSFQSKRDGPFRASLKGYSISYLDHVNSMLSSALVVSYLLFCISYYSSSVLTPYILWTAPLVIFNILRYLQLVTIEDLGEDPTNMLINDKVSITIFLTWLILIVAIIHF